MINPFMSAYDILKQQVFEHEENESVRFDNLLQELRQYKHPSAYINNYEEKIFQSKTSGSFEVLEYFNYDNIAIRFLNSNYRMIARANNINRGEVKDPYSISVLGIGYNGVGPYSIDNPFTRMIRSRWRGIIERCYILKEGNKFMHPEWFNFQLFAAWFHSEFYELPGISMYDMCVDKDIMNPLNEEYSPYKCLIIPSFINTKVQLKDSVRNNIMRYLSGIMSEKDRERLILHKLQREKYIHDLGEKYKNILPGHVYLAIKSYKMF